MNPTASYYDILGLDPAATLAQIKRAYRSLARRYHPDVNGGDAAAAGRFKEITEAYEVLSDPRQRANYDRPVARSPASGSRRATATPSTSRWSAASSACWRTPGGPSSTTTARYRPWSSSLPAAPTASRPGGAITPRSAGTSPTRTAPKS